MPSAESGLLNQTFLANTVCEEVSAVLAAETPQYKLIRVIMAPPYNFDNPSILASSKIHNDGKIFNPDERLSYFIAPAALNSSDGFCLTE